MSEAEEQSVHMSADSQEYVTVEIADQLFGIEVTDIHDVFQPQCLTAVPMAPPEVRGVLNLRGRIVTAIDARQRLGLPPRADEDKPCMAVGVEIENESYSLLIDRVGEVLRLLERNCEAVPCNMDPQWQAVSKGIYRLEKQLLIILDIKKMLNVETPSAQAA